MTTRQCLHSLLAGISFSKIESRDDEHVTYAAEVSGTFVGKVRYLLAFVPRALAGPLKGRTSLHLSDLPWVNFQSRYVPRLATPTRQQPLHFPKGVENPMLVAFKRDMKEVKYNAPDGQVITLFNDPAKKTMWQYRDKMTLLGCVDTFACSITITPEEYAVTTVGATGVFAPSPRSGGCQSCMTSVGSDYTEIDFS